MREVTFAPLESFADVTMGQSPGADSCNSDSKGPPFLQGCAEFGRRSPVTSISCQHPLRIGKAGSVLISVRAPVGTMNYADQDYCIGRGLAAITDRPGLSDITFLKHAIELNSRYLHRRSQGSTFAAVSSDDIRSLPIPNFRLNKQSAVAAILTCVDTAIEKTEALIDKYQKIKAGLMHDLFTRGVLPSGELRATRGNEPGLYCETSIGWLPRDWQVVELGELAEIVSGVTLGAKEDPSEAVDAPYLRVANVQDGYLDLTDIKTVRISPKTLESLRLLPGDVLVNEGGDFDKLGRGAVWAGEIRDCVHQNHVFRVRTNSHHCSPTSWPFTRSPRSGRSISS